MGTEIGEPRERQITHEKRTKAVAAVAAAARAVAAPKLRVLLVPPLLPAPAAPFVVADAARSCTAGRFTASLASAPRSMVADSWLLGDGEQLLRSGNTRFALLLAGRRALRIAAMVCLLLGFACGSLSTARRCASPCCCLPIDAATRSARRSRRGFKLKDRETTRGGQRRRRRPTDSTLEKTRRRILLREG